jgi:hypothetical protein
MRQFAVLVLLAVPATLPAQQNPFKPPKPAVQKFEVTSILTGDMKGNVLLAMDGDRMVRVSADTMKMMGKTSHNSTWNLTTPDSVWHADLAKKTGTVSPNMLSYMAEAYDNLDGDGKKRFTQNIADLATMMSKAFNIGQINSGEKLGTKTYAGHECEERKFGGFTVCQIEKTPIVLHTAGKLLCLNFEETATSVRLGSASPALFNPPADVKFQSDTSMSRPDSVANGFVGYMASQSLSDSIAKGKAELEAARAKQAQSGDSTKMTPAQEAQMQEACEMIKNINLNKLMADAAKAWKNALVEAAKNEGKKQAVKGLRGLIKKPKFVP